MVGTAPSTARGEIREDKAAKRKAPLTKAGESTKSKLNRPWRTVPDGDAARGEKDDDEPRYTAWLGLPISTREPMTARDANAARKALLDA